MEYGSGFVGRAGFFPLPPGPDEKGNDQNQVNNQADHKKSNRRTFVDLRISDDSNFGLDLFGGTGLLIAHGY